MKLENVFIAFTKDGEEKIVLKKHKSVSTSMGDVYMTVYIDLETKKEVDNLDTSTLCYASSALGIEENFSTRRKVVKAYKLDRNTLIDFYAMYYGNIIYKFKGDEDILKKNALMARVSDPEGKSLELETGIRYYRSERFDNNGVCVKEIRPISYNGKANTVEPKKKILELNYKKEL